MGCFQFGAITNNTVMSLAVVAQLVEASFRRLKSHGFDSRSGHMPRLQFDSSWNACEKQPIDVSLPFFLPPFLSLCMPSLG